MLASALQVHNAAPTYEEALHGHDHGLGNSFLLRSTQANCTKREFGQLLVQDTTQDRGKDVRCGMGSQVYG